MSPDGSGNPFVSVPITIGRHKRLQRTAGRMLIMKQIVAAPEIKLWLCF